MKFCNQKNLFKKSISLFLSLLMMISITCVIPSNALAKGKKVQKPAIGSTTEGISGIVFFDRNGNGKYEPSDHLFFEKKVKVNLYDSSGTFIKKTWTDTKNGYYIFKELRRGRYTVEIVPPSGYAITKKGKGNNVKDRYSEVYQETGRFEIDFGPNSLDNTVDAGLKIGNNIESNRAITDVTRNFPNESIVASSEYEFVYNIDGDEIEYNVEKPVEIVLVLNTSGTMKSYINGKYKGKLIEAANSFIDNLPINKNIKVGVVRYYYKGEVISELEYIRNKAEVKQKINDKISISRNGTNLGDGLRRAYQLLQKGNQNADKHLVILSDGYANVGIKEKQQGREWENVPYVFNLDLETNDMIDDENYYFFPMKSKYHFMDGYKDEKLNVGQEYVRGIAEEINKASIKINSHIIHFKRTVKAGSGKLPLEDYIKGGMNNVNEVASILGVTKEINEGQKFYLVKDADSLNTAFENIETAIKESIPFNSVYYEETFPSGVELVDYPNGLTKTGNLDTGYTLKGNVSGVNMKKVRPESNSYKVDGQFSVTIRCDSPREYEFDNGKVLYEDPVGFVDEVQINTGSIGVTDLKRDELNILEVQPTQEFELEVSMFTSIAKEEDINIVQMSMAQFISDIEKINGKYDVVYVGNKDNQYTHIGNRADDLPQGGVNGSDSEEYYSENDITNRKAKDLKEFINSGQLTIFSNSVFNDSETKLFSNFNVYKGNKHNFITTDDIGDEMRSISQLYDNCNKRPILTLADSPRDFTGTLDNGTSNAYEDTKNMHFIFHLENLNTTGNNENSMNVKLYLDKNGDGFFREDEMVEQGEPKLNGRGYLLDYRLEEYFTGMMPWKLEIEDTETGSKAYKTGYPAYKGEKLEVRVLHLIPGNGTQLSIENKTNQFVPPLNTEDYKIMITELPINKFNNNYPNDVNYDGKSIKTTLNGNYDMIIMGFKDCYGHSDLTNENAIKAIKDFIKTEQSVMFTHDVFTFNTKNQSGWGANLTKEFRDIVGQSRYKDPNNLSELDSFGNVIIHDDLEDSNKKTYGFTTEALDRAKNNKFDTYKKTFKLNESVITKYPYVLPEELTVAKTHYQYYQLNLEDEDVVPWYTLNDNGDKKYDGRNYYYTYSKGNITYSGTGHSKPSGQQEQKFFVNTMIKASRSANHAPTLEVINLEEDKIVSKSQEKFEFSFIASDIDGDALSGEVHINGVLIESYDEVDIQHGEPVNVVITKGDLEQILGENEEFTIKIVVKDSKGAMAEENGNLIYLDNPGLNMTVDEEQKYLIGDLATVKLQVIAQRPIDNLQTEINNIHFSMDYEESVLQADGSINWNLDNVIFNPAPTPTVQDKTFKFELNQVGNYKVNNTLTYKYSNFNSVVNTETVNYSYPISVREGKIDVKVLNSDATPFGRVQVEVTKPDGSTVTYNTDDRGIITLNNQPSGEYTFTLNNLNDKYMIKSGNSKAIDLSYDNHEQEVKFELIDTSKIGLDLISNGGNEYLVGDTANITLGAIAHNDDDSINTLIKNIDYSMIFNSNALELITDNENWELRNIEIFGNDIPRDRVQTKNLSFKIKKAGDYEVINTLEYEYLNDVNGIGSATHNFHVRSGKINAKVVKPDGRSYENIPMKVENEDNGEIIDQGTTNSFGNYELTNIPSGNYIISTTLPDGFGDENGNSREVTISFNEPVHDIVFELKDSAIIVKNGMYINNKFVDSNKVVTGFDANLAAEFKVFDKQPDIRLILDEEITKVQLKLFKVDSSGNLTVVSGDIEVYNIEERTEDGNVIEITTDLNVINGKVDLESIIAERKIKIVVPEATDQHNSYLLKYIVAQNAPITKISENNFLEFNIEVNKVRGIEGQLVVVELPTLD